MSLIRRFGLTAVLGATLLILVGCQTVQDKQEFEYLPLFSDGTHDASAVVATVNGVPITGRDMELRLDEMKDSQRTKYRGPEGQRLLLKEMVDTMILVQEAVDLALYNDQDVYRTLNINRRQTLEIAMRNIGILRGNEPTDDDLLEYFMDHRQDYQKVGAVMARHVECATKSEIDRAWARLQTGEWKDRFEVVVQEFSVNERTKAEDGSLGWFNKGGYIPDIKNGAAFTEVAYDLQDGVNAPIEIDGRLHLTVLVPTAPIPVQTA